MALGAHENKEPKIIFSSLKVYQHVTLKDVSTAFTLSFLYEETLLAHRVVEILSYYIVVRDVAP